MFTSLTKLYIFITVAQTFSFIGIQLNDFIKISTQVKAKPKNVKNIHINFKDTLSVSFLFMCVNHEGMQDFLNIFKIMDSYITEITRTC